MRHRFIQEVVVQAARNELESHVAHVKRACLGMREEESKPKPQGDESPERQGSHHFAGIDHGDRRAVQQVAQEWRFFEVLPLAVLRGELRYGAGGTGRRTEGATALRAGALTGRAVWGHLGHSGLCHFCHCRRLRRSSSLVSGRGVCKYAIVDLQRKRA